MQRAGLWIINLLEAENRPLNRAELEPLLRKRGIIPDGCTKAYVGNAIAAFRNKLVYLDPTGYWLARKPWPAPGYRPGGHRAT